MRPDQLAAHHALYRDRIMPALNREGATLTAFFDTVIGPSTNNTSSHRSVELWPFPDLEHWQRWHVIQNADKQLSNLLKRKCLSAVARVGSFLLYPMDYSRIR